MQRTMLPFRIEIMKLTDEKVKNLTPVTSLDFYEHAGGQLADHGLFSVPIFGRIGSDERDARFSYIDLHTRVFHPAIFQTLVALKGLYGGILSSTIFARWDASLKDFVVTDELHGQTGFAFFMAHWEQIVFHRTKSPVRDIRIAVIEKYKDRGTIDKLLVIPAGFRDIEESETGRPVINEVNEFYRSILAAANNLADSKALAEDPSQDRTRMRLQTAVNGVYDYFTNFLQGKKGFVQNRWGGRKIASGTRNVISALTGNDAELGSQRFVKYTDVVAGLYQSAVALLPVTIFHLRTHYLEPIFNMGGGHARLVNPKTLKAELVEVSLASFDKWTTNEGLEKVISAYGEPSSRLKPVVIDGYYLALIYRGPDKTYRIFSDIDELPEHLDRKDVFPINYTELLYLSMVPAWNKYHAQVTRYPITGTGSTYMATIYVMTTTVGEERWELGEDWEKLGGDHVAVEFPKPGLKSFMDSMSVHGSRLEGLGGDHDGDTCTYCVVMSDEANKASEQYLNSLQAFVDPRGGLRASVSTTTSELVMRSMTA